MHITFAFSGLIWLAAFFWGRQKARQTILPLDPYKTLAAWQHDLAFMNRTGHVTMWTAALVLLFTAAAYLFSFSSSSRSNPHASSRSPQAVQALRISLGL
jgi:hypothetical protein